MHALAIEYDEMWHGEILIRIKWGLHRVKNYLNEDMIETFNQAKLDKVDVCMKMTNLNWKKNLKAADVANNTLWKNYNCLLILIFGSLQNWKFKHDYQVTLNNFNSVNTVIKK